MSYEPDEIEVPVISITDGWDVDDIQTEDDCDDAFAVLTAMVVSIEARMDDLAMLGNELSVDYKRAKSALRWKKAALSVVNTKRGQIRRREKDAADASQTQKVIDYFRAVHPEELKAAMNHVRAGTVELIAEGKAA